jgi:outer membrane protein
MTFSAGLLIAALPLRVLTLSEAVRTAEVHQPQLHQARSTVAGAEAQVEISRAPLLPQVSGKLGYQRRTANSALRAADSVNNSLDTYNGLSAGLYLSQSIYDFGATLGKYRASQAIAESTREAARLTKVQVVLKVRQTFFQASAQKALIKVAKEALLNQQRHLQQIEGFVQVGTRPSIDLAQARTDVANAKLQLISAESGYRTARAQLMNAMGEVGSLEFEVSDETLSAVAGEDGAAEALVKRAIAARPELASLQRQVESSEQLVRSAKGGYWPALSFSMSLTEDGDAFTNLAWNWSAGVSLSWSIFQGLQTRGQVRAARAAVDGLHAQEDALLQQVRLDVLQAQLSIRAARESVVAADSALANAGERLRLAEGRYATGVGNAIELGDAQAALTSAAGTRVQAQFNLFTARAQLLAALGGK